MGVEISEASQDGHLQDLLQQKPPKENSYLDTYGHARVLRTHALTNTTQGTVFGKVGRVELDRSLGLSQAIDKNTVLH